ncbi:MAG: NGG1p interacting factor NIF3 [Candidatus Moranbacteria bacterium]|nr:NGG1p interacting factor NIF3 [Candidatus Moranbacteria bacterium]
MSKKYKLIVFVPVADADKVREAIHAAGGGKLGNYSHSSFSSRGTGRFKPEQGANPSFGKVGKIEEIEEERIEVLCEENVVQDVVAAMKKAHPYEEVAYDVYELAKY